MNPVASPWLGAFALVAVVLCEAGFAVFGKCVKTPLTGIQKNLMSNTITLVLCVPLTLYELQTFDVMTMTAHHWYASIYMGLFATGVAGALWFWGIQYVRANDGGIALTCIPLFGVLSAVFILDEILLPVHILGGALILIALWLTMRDGVTTK